MPSERQGGQKTQTQTAKRPEWDEAIEIASHVPITVIADRLQIPIVRSGQEWQHKEFDSLKISENKWHRWSGRTGDLGKYTGGLTIQFVQEYCGVQGFRDAVIAILDITDPDRADSLKHKRIPLKERLGTASNPRRAAKAQEKTAHQPPPPAKSAEAEERKPFVLPARSPVSEHVFSYLTKKRGIDREIVIRELREGRIYENTFGSCVFVGFDPDGKAAFASVRSSYDGDKVFKKDISGSRKAFSWRIVPENSCRQVLVFESPIEALSYMSLIKAKGQDWTKSAYLSLGGTGGVALFNFLDRASDPPPDVYLCLNNDEAGREGSEALNLTLGGSAKIVMPVGGENDWNDALRSYRARQRSRQSPGRGESR